MKKVFVSIINYNNEDDTKECLDSLKKLKQDNFDLHIVVIDNASTQLFTLPENYLSPLPLTVIRNKENTGFTGGHTTGIHYALSHSADYVLVLNNDVIVDKNLIYELLSAAEKDSQIGIIVPKIYFASGSEYHKDRYSEKEKGNVLWYAGGLIDWENVITSHRGVDEVDAGQYDTNEETQQATGCCMLIKKEILEKIGVFDKRYFMYYEDSDFSMRVKNEGYKIMYVPRAKMWHKNASSAGGAGSELQDYFLTRNRLLFGMTYASLRARFALLRESVSILKGGRHAQKVGVKDYYFRRFGKGSYKSSK